MASVAVHVISLFAGSFFSLAPGLMPLNVGALGGCESRLNVAGWLVVPPALSAVQVNATTPSVVIVCGSQSVVTTGDSVSVAIQLSPTLLWNHPLAPSGPAGAVTAPTAGGDASSTTANFASAWGNPKPQSLSGNPGAEVQSIMPRGSRRIAYSSSTLIDGFADQRTAATPAALGAAALVPKKGLRSGYPVSNLS